LTSIGDFDAILINQRTIKWSDMPKQSERRPEQYYIMWGIESPAYPFMDIHQLNNYFNSTMTYRRDSDFPYPYGRVVQTKEHPPLGSPELANLIDEFGKNNRYLVQNRTGAKAAWLVSNCATKSKRESLVKELQKYIPVQVIESRMSKIFIISFA
jgi:alpha-1,3-fucosyltransferase